MLIPVRGWTVQSRLLLNTLNETPLLWGEDQRKPVGFYSLSVPWHFENRMECPSGKIWNIFRAFQIQSCLAANMSVLVKTRIFLLLLNCLGAGMGVLLWNSLLNSLGQRSLFCCVQIISGRGRLLCENVHRSFWDQGKDLSLVFEEWRTCS